MWANFKAIIGISSPRIGASLAIWTNPVQFSLFGVMGAKFGKHARSRADIIAEIQVPRDAHCSRSDHRSDAVLSVASPRSRPPPGMSRGPGAGAEPTSCSAHSLYAKET